MSAAAAGTGASWGLLFDSTRCIDCGACSAACKEQNELKLPIEERTTAYTWTVVEKKNGVNVRRMCMHCLTPTCASVCPVGALRKTEPGPVVYDAKKCIGCRYCVMACPFDAPKYQWDQPVPIVGKCILCAPRIAAGKPTACATVCPTGATRFGTREELIAEARARIAAEPSRYVDRIYGIEEAGGTSVLMLAGVPFSTLGFRDVPRGPLPVLTWQVLSHVPDIALYGGALLYGVHWITKRRAYVALKEGPAGAVEPPSGDHDGGHS
jgi:formate dehydrogenase iron-sulfur subunit